jgi:hypothetical protein
MADAELTAAYGKYAQKDVYAYSVITTPCNGTFNRMGRAK